MEKTPSMRKFFILIALWFSLVICVIIGVQIYNYFEAAPYNETAIPYINQVIPEISQWDIEKTKKLMAPEIVATIPDKAFTQVITRFSRLGAFESMEEPEFEKVYPEKKTAFGVQTIVVYEVKAKYENGDALITIKLLDRDGSFEVFRFNLSSNTLAN